MSVNKLFCIGNPLLDISAEVDQAFLDKYGVKLNNAILAEEAHLPVFDDLVKNKNPLFIAGGATQNTARVAQWQVNSPGAVAYAGAIGKDKFGDELEKASKADGLTTCYYKVDGTPTGTCAVLVSGGERSLIANLSAAEKYVMAHTESAEVQKAIGDASIYYIAGFVLTHSADSIMSVCKHADANGKTMTMNCSAPFLFQVPPFLAAFKEAWEYLDIVFGNESEAEVMSEAFGFGTKDIKEIAQKAAAMPKKNSAKPRMVVITQGPESTVVATADKVDVYAVPKVDKIVDTNGAGDAFCGGFLSQIMQGKSVEEACKCGHYTASVVIQRSGCQFADATRYGA
jgi:adenosine kinase